MSLRIVEAEPAIADIDDVTDYLLEKGGPDVALRFLEAVKRVEELVASMPGIGALRDFGDPELIGMRMLPIPRFPKYLLYYRATDQFLVVFRVIHGAQVQERAFHNPGQS